MSVKVGPKIVKEGLIFDLDAAVPRSYSGSGLTAYGLVGGTGATLVNGVGFSSFNSGFFSFDGTNDFINIPYPSGLSTGSPITLSLWAKWITTGTTTDTIQTLVDNNYQTVPSIGFLIQDRPDLGGILEWGAQPGAGITRCMSTFVVGDGTWRHITGTNDGTTSILFIDGVQSGLARTAAGIGLQQANINIGRWDFTDSRYLNGSIPGLLIYNRALTAKEILQNYNATKGKYI